MTAITRKRGDTYAETITITDTRRVPIDITGYTFRLTVDQQEAPVDTSTNLFSVAGTILDAAAGTVEFALTAQQADRAPGTYYYDLQLTDGAGRIRTVALDKWVVVQDISK